MDTRMFEQLSVCVLLNAEHIELKCCDPSSPDREPHRADLGVWMQCVCVCVCSGRDLVCWRVGAW